MTQSSGEDVPIVKLQHGYFRHSESINTLQHKFDPNDTQSYTLRDVSVEVKAGNRVLVVGSNGSGKSTLLTLLSGQRKANNNRKDSTNKDGKVLLFDRFDAFDDAMLSQKVCCFIGQPWPSEAYFGSTVGCVSRPFSDNKQQPSQGDKNNSFEAKQKALADELHLNLNRNVDQMSLGERRRVQILCSWLKAENGSDNLLYVLDECSTDLDVAERQAVLGRIRRETDEVKVIRFSANDSNKNKNYNKVNSDDGDVVYKGRGACLYATHIFDGLQGWATHVLYIRNGEIQSFESVEELTARTAKEGEVFSIEQYAHALLSQDYRYTERKGIVHDNSPFFNVYQNSQFSFREFEEMRDAIHHKKDLGDPTNSDSSNFIQLYKSIQNQRNYWEEGKAKGDNTVLLEFDHFSYKTILENVSFQIHTGERVLLSGCNGCGKTTLLNILGGKQCIYRNRPNGPNGTVKLFVKPTADDDGVYLYEDGMKYMHDNVAYGGDWWTRVPGGEVHVYQLLSQYVEYDDGEGRNPNTPYNVHAEKERQAGRYRMNSPRGDFLQHLLQVQLQWDIRKCSAGEVKRVLLLLVLLPDKRLVLLDEATADLDVHQRHALLLFLYLESAFRGVTVCYCTHIFGGLQSWASRLILLDRTQKGVVHEETQGDGGDIALDSVTTLLTQLKEKETF